ncbi:MAG: Smr/MutS family protein [Clostridia bacterium]|nr:Smr/MutS family protein [Clostridia bacterium]
MNEPFVRIDLHGCSQDEAIRRIDRALDEATSSTYQLQLIHGYHRGTNLRTMIQSWYRYEPRVLRIIPGDNPGITILVLRELYTR